MSSSHCHQWQTILPCQYPEVPSPECILRIPAVGGKHWPHSPARDLHHRHLGYQVAYKWREDKPTRNTSCMKLIYRLHANTTAVAASPSQAYDSSLVAKSAYRLLITAPPVPTIPNVDAQKRLNHRVYKPRTVGLCAPVAVMQT